MPVVPVEFLAHARLAAASGVDLELLLRGYGAGHTLLICLILEEATRGRPEPAELRSVAIAQTALSDLIIVAAIAEYDQELARRSELSDDRKSRLVRQLLAGELVDPSPLAYDFDGWHLGAMAVGLGADEALRKMASHLGRRGLTIRDEGGTLCSWFGGRDEPTATAVDEAARIALPEHVTVAIGEPAFGVAGWRLSHRQAAAALPLARLSSERLVRYATVALPASVLKDELLSRSLHDLYIAPLAFGRDGGEALRNTLRAFLAADQNVSAAAAALGVKRHTVTKRLRLAEERFGRSVSSCATELDITLRLEELGAD